MSACPIRVRGDISCCGRSGETLESGRVTTRLSNAECPFHAYPSTLTSIRSHAHALELHGVISEARSESNSGCPFLNLLQSAGPKGNSLDFRGDPGKISRIAGGTKSPSLPPSLDTDLLLPHPRSLATRTTASSTTLLSHHHITRVKRLTHLHCGCALCAS